MDDGSDYQKFAFALQKERELICIQQAKQDREKETEEKEEKELDRLVGLYNTANLSEDEES